MSSTTEDRDAAGDPTRDPAFARTRPRRGLARAVDELAADVTGPVHDPDGADAAVELAGLLPAAPPGLVAVVGAVDSADVASAVRWAAAHDVAVVLAGAGVSSEAGSGSGREGAPAPRAGARPTLVVTRRRIDRVVVDATLGTARVGVGATWPAVRAALGAPGLPAAGVVGDSCGRPRDVAALCGATVVTEDGLLHRVDDAEEPQLWARVLDGDGRGPAVTELELVLG